MRSDLQGLEIGKREFRHWTGLGFDAIFSPPILPKFCPQLLKKLLLLPLIALSGWILAQIFVRDQLLAIALHLFLAVELIVWEFWRLYRSYKYRSLGKLMGEVVSYNNIIQAIDLNDRIEEAGNPHVKLEEREKVLAALQLTREDLIRALKTERILRENAKFMRINPHLFASNLTALTTLQVSDRATEHGRLLNEALQIAIDVQQQVKNLPR
ncbi:hypothetical protein [Merismopedia glauca]|uniref:Uncharacterized protein n=1 Tax=Merismopedia glauca CCAP 1448/3 TaxID=1296344 RepID=A0A2T1C738_9CYAN|nr:hypothetical protein [Merismopedia glauca]PSB03978.1 hypothetical protein C7B64_05920 [Merismopedia glauca CCAP 1448/3]